MALPSGAQESGGHVIDSDGVPLVRVDGGSGGSALVVEGSTATEITASTYTSGALTAYTERRPADLKTRTWTITRNTDGSIATATVTAWA